MRRITSIKLKDGFPTIGWADDGALTGIDDATHKGECECLPSFQAAWDSLGPVIGRVVGLPEIIAVTPTGCRPSIDPDTDLLSVKLDGSIQCVAANGPANISVPKLKQCQDDDAPTHMPDWVADPVKALIVEAERYMAGEYAQGTLPLGDGAPDGESVGTVESDPTPPWDDAPEGEPEPLAADDDGDTPAEGAADPDDKATERHEHEGQSVVDPDDPALEDGGRAYNAGLEAGRAGDASVCPDDFQGAARDLWARGYNTGAAERDEGASEPDGDDTVTRMPPPKKGRRANHLHAVG